MGGPKRLSKDRLAELYPDPQWRDRLLEISAYVEMLEECILRRDYKVPDDLNSAILLSEAGKEVQKVLATKHNVNAKDARVLCLLKFAHIDLLIDVEHFDTAALRKSINRQILAQDLLYPFAFGRELYDKASSLFEDETWSLSYEDTLRLLEGTPTGVFQLRQLVVGPYGILTSRETRWLPPTQVVPLFHCAELTCDLIHRCQLSSDPAAPINVSRAKIIQVLNQISEQPSAWDGFLREISDFNSLRYDDRSRAPLPLLIGDALSDRELRLLAVDLMDSTGGKFRNDLDALGIGGNATEALRDLDRAKLMQLVLLCKDDEIAYRLDHLVSSGRIEVPPAEVRRPVVYEAYATGLYNLRAQLGRRGVRFVSTSMQVAQLRLRRLVDRLYRLDSPGDAAELEFQLREIDAPGIEARLEEFVSSATPEEVLTRLVLARHANVITASEELSVDNDLYPADTDLIDAMLWKLGFDVDRESDVNETFWRYHVQMKNLTQTASISAVTDQERVRSLASNYFWALEGVLEDSLAYCTWALTSDHLATPRPFTYRDQTDQPEALIRLNDAEVRRAPRNESIQFSDKNELYPLCRGFHTLAWWLQDLREHEESYARSPEAVPPDLRYSDLRRFPFQHTVAYLDLIADAKERIPTVLDELSQRLVKAGVSDVRNEWLHYRRSTADVANLGRCLSAIEWAVDTLELEGFCRVRFHPIRESGDTWGRRIYVLGDSKGREIGIARPVHYDTSQMPRLRSPQYLMTAAVFAVPGEMLRFTSSVGSEYSAMWDNYPARRQAGRLLPDRDSPGDSLGVGSSPTVSGSS
jgi:hypothetical protein